MMKKKSLLLLSTLLFSCSPDEETFKCIYSNMYEASFALPNRLVNQKIIIDNENIDTEQNYYNIYILHNLEERNEFLRTENLSYSEGDYIDFSITSDNIYLVIIALIPPNYRAYKRPNIQYIRNDEEILVTDNFYYYINRKDNSYLYIDLVKDATITNYYTYSFYYILDSSYTEQLTSENIAVYYNLN